MKGLIDTIRNILKIEDLRTRIFNTIGLILIYRLGSYVVLPGVDPDILQSANRAQQGLTRLLDMFAGGHFHALPYWRWESCLTYRHPSSFNCLAW